MYELLLIARSRDEGTRGRNSPTLSTPLSSVKRPPPLTSITVFADNWGGTQKKIRKKKVKRDSQMSIAWSGTDKNTL